MPSASIRRIKLSEARRSKLWVRSLHEQKRLSAGSDLLRIGSDRALDGLDTSKIDYLSQPFDEGTTIDEQFVEHSLDQESLDALEHVAKFPYWTCTWILQEIALAKDIIVLYGSVSLPWQKFEGLRFVSLALIVKQRFPRGLWADYSKYETITLFGVAVGVFVEIRRRRQEPLEDQLDILTLAWRHSNLNATDTRDRIYGFCGLASDGAQFVINADYSKSAVDVYKSFARMHIEESCSLRVILYAGFRKSGDQQFSLPSWVPDWFNMQEKIAPYVPERLYAAARDTTHSIQSSATNSLLVDGVHCGSTTMFKLGFTGREDLLFSRGPFDHPSGIPRLQALFRTLVADRHYYGLKRLFDDTSNWFYHDSAGFLLDLGIQVDPSSQYAESAFGIRQGGGATPEDQNVDATESDWRKYDFIVAFRDWAEWCIEVLGDRIHRRRVPKPGSDGALKPNTWAGRTLDDSESSEPAMEQAISDVDHLLSWKEALEKTRSCASIESALELLLGAPGSPHTKPWVLNKLTNNHGAAAWLRYKLNTGTTVGDNPTFITNSGYIGVGPKYMRSGDEIYVLLGCPVPVVLRSVGIQYILIGQCCVYGLMDGEAIDSAAAHETLELV